MRSLLFAPCALVVLSASGVRADILLYPLPGTNVAFALQGKVSPNPGGSVTFRHPQFGNLFFSLDRIKYYKAASTREIASRRLAQAINSQDADACIEAGSWALHHGLLPKFYEAASAAWKLDGDHATVKRLAALKQKMDAPPPPTGKQELQMREFVPGGDRMEFARSRHFLLLHDTPATKGDRTNKTRGEERLELLETVYASLMLKFCLEGAEIDVPKEPLKVVLFAEKKGFLDFAESLDASLSNAAGFFDRRANVSVFYDQGTNEIHQLLDRLNQDLQADKRRAIKERSRGARDLVRFAETIRLLTEVARENADIEVVSHEATHQLAANTGLMPNGSPVPIWAAEGLATYFESPKDAAWSGIGAVNKERLRWYRGLAEDREHSNIDFVVSDRVFTDAVTEGAVAHAYGQSWALTHYLMDRHSDKLTEYYRLIAKNTTDERLSPDKYQEAFDQVFGDVKEGLELDWRSYMRSLKTDLERVLEER